jgi:uncharacterized SAM-binding protein YcdF (DUF218 family)
MCLAFSPLSVCLAWGVLYPEVEQLADAVTFDAIVVLSGEDRRIERGLELAEEGRAPVLVFSYGERWASIRDRCGSKGDYEILCPEPTEDSTRGEARMFREMVDKNEWKSILVVTADYHVTRARLLIDQCVESVRCVSFEVVKWENLSVNVRRSEAAKRVSAFLIERRC